MVNKNIIYQQSNILQYSTHNIDFMQVDNRSEQIQISYYDKKGKHFVSYTIEFLEQIGFINFQALEKLL